MTAAFLLAALAAAPAGRPNVLWITCEDLSPRLGCYGDDLARSPRLDRLAAQGTRYSHAFGVYGVCAPNRYCLITGRLPWSDGAGPMRTMKRTGALADVTDPELRAIPTWEATPPPQVRCFPELLRAAGYFCTNDRKTDYQFRAPPTVWDRNGKGAGWRDRPGHGTPAAAPFFAVVNFTTTHESKVHRRTSPAVTDRAAVTVPPFLPDVPSVREDLARQYDNLAALDRQVGAVLDDLAADGLADDTVVMFFSDHGDGLPRHKRWVYDSGTQVPLIVRFPPGHPDCNPPGGVSDRLVSFVDFAPTVLSLAGLEPRGLAPGDGVPRRPRVRTAGKRLPRPRPDGPGGGDGPGRAVAAVPVRAEPPAGPAVLGRHPLPRAGGVRGVPDDGGRRRHAGAGPVANLGAEQAAGGTLRLRE